MQNNVLAPLDLEFEISGEKLGDFEQEVIPFYEPNKMEIAKAVHSVILRKAWGWTSLEEIRCQITKKLNFVDLVKVKLDFSEKYNSCCSIFTDNLFGWIYYNENEKLETFSFILNISTGEIKFLLNN